MSKRPSWDQQINRAELSELWHLSPTALAGERDQQGKSKSSSRYWRIHWAAAQYAKAHPETSITGAYKVLDREMPAR